MCDPDLIPISDAARAHARVEKPERDADASCTGTAEREPPDTMLGRFLERLSLTPAQVETLAGVKFPCC